MTNEDIIRMARESGLVMYDYSDPSLERFANLVAAAEREACAKFLLSTDLSGLKSDPELQNFIANLLANYAAAIRTRGQG